MVISNNTVNPINKYHVVPQIVTLVITLTKVLNKRRKISHRKKVPTLKGSQSDNTASSILISTTVHSVSQEIIHAHNEKNISIISMIQNAVQTLARLKICSLMTLT